MKRLRILVVDDEQLVRDYLAQGIALRGYQVRAAGSRQAALEIVKAWRPDAAAVDVHLPDGSGLALLPALREANAEVRIVVMSGFGTIRSSVDALKAGAVDYLCKPLTFEDVIRVLDPTSASSSAMSTQRSRDSQMTLEQARWEHIQRTLVATSNNISESARRLGIRRQSLQRMLQKRPPSPMF
jgi:two-component system response regulator RegA